ncbi:MAG TPA: plastocyanin/azurin family copper-binding protein [Candidatus Limnocylindrales bacterium]
MIRLGLLLVLALGVAGVVAGRMGDVSRVEIAMRYSHFSTAEVTVRAGVPVTVVLRNDDPIDHEWIVGDAASHDRHRTGTEPVHGARPTEVSVPAGTTVVTTVTFRDPGEQLFICHLPGHEAYGMVGRVVVVPSG